MWLLKQFQITPASPPPSPPEYDEPWRHLDWKQNHLKDIKNFQPGNKEINTLRILLYGPQGAGKSSFFNSVNSVFQGRITTRALAQSASTGQSFTLECKTYKIKKETDSSFYPFTFTDIAGMNNGDTSIKTEDVVKLLNGHIKDGYIFNPAKSITGEDSKFERNPALKDRVHCLVAVLPADTVSMMDEKVIKHMREVRKKARDLGIPQTIIMTKVDEVCPLVKANLEKIYTSKKIKQKMEECCHSLGVPMSFIYPVKNYHEERVTNATVDTLILDALTNILNFANDYVEDQIENE